ncbi:PadR family transcriptional regulator [Magnetovibrio sp.]|uniref:PadR family transcriptional regulator n=1 Tax=Magnetovibrio sp. TaxID=2024836 RepID=UPI002F94B650
MDVKTLCLGVLSLGDASGYEIRKMFEEGPFAHFHQASFGSIYPALSKLLEAEQVTCTVEAQDGRPDKKVYSITEAGLSAFRAALRKKPDMDRVRSETLFMLFFADHLDDAHLTEVYDGYMADYRFYVEKMAQLDNTGLSRGRRFVRGFGMAFYQGVLKYMEDNRDAFFAAAKDDGWRDLESIRECMDCVSPAIRKHKVGEDA